MSVTFGPALSESYFAAAPEVLVCWDTEKPFASMCKEWRTQVDSYDTLSQLGVGHCAECAVYAPMPQRLMPDEYTEMNLANANAAELLRDLGVAQYTETSDGHACVELSGAISVETLEQSLVIALWTAQSQHVEHYAGRLTEVIRSAKRLGCTEISYA